MDVTELLLIVAAVTGTIAAAMHMLGYVPPRYKRVLREIQASTASSIGHEVERALNASLDRQRALAEEDMVKAQAAMEAEAAKAGKSLDMSIVRSVGVDKQQQAAVSNMLASQIVEQYLPMLRMVLPGVADQLEENPQLIFSIIENPYFKKYVLPRIQSFIPSEGATPGSGASHGSGWG